MDPHYSTIYRERRMSNSTAIYSSVIRSGRMTYFVDVKEAKNGKRYLSITENRIDEDEKKERVTVRVFKETVDQFRLAVDEASAAVTA